ncbi:MAG: class I SAM-dependent DNA methyltransferase [Kiritimatiellae bacterium]|nr:class I SAM-dependent DNA methyltransferase [Kiritimatiellia bacterium]
MTSQQQRAAAKEFADFWKGKGYEKGQTQPFWIGLLRVLGVENPDRGYIEFEDRAHIDAAHGFIDGYLPATRVLVEQKSIGKNLRASIAQSDGSVLTPYQQAKRYIVDLPLSRHPRWVVTCNFESFLVYDMERPNAEPETILLENLPDELYRLSFLVQTEADFIRREEEISKAAGDVVGRIYDALLKQYRDPTSPASLKSLNELCVRLVFLFYAEDAGVFRHLQFRDYIRRFPARDARRALIDLFKVLDTRPEDRDPYLEPDLAAFPYVNGGLFANENLEIPQLTDEILALVVKNGSEEFDWKDISPTIFGAVFESTLNPETRRSGGMHYTSLANIHKVIGPLFLDALSRRVDEALRTTEHTENTEKKGSVSPVSSVVKNKLRALQDEMASLTFLDPACGSGNFLTETYVCLRRLENRIIAALQDGQGRFDLEGDTVKVSIRQFHGIEINDFAVAVAKSALWIAESQMLNETQALLHRNIDFLPLKTYDGIVEGNALRLDWSSLLCQCGSVANPNSQSQLETGNSGTGNIGNNGNTRAFDYIMGNPPFVGAMLTTTGQKEDMASVFGEDWKGLGELDYVAGWYKKSFDYMVAHPATRTALVSTNSISQGQAVASLFGPLMERGLTIDFAHRTFRWDSESNSKAHVHCVIVGFSCGNGSQETAKKALFEGERMTLVPHINGYLLPAPDAVVGNRSAPLCDVPPMHFGNMPRDGGALLLSPEERDELLAAEPQAEPLVRPILGAEEFIKGYKRYCLWLVDASPALLNRCPRVLERIRRCREFRLASKAASTRKFAETPALFCQITQPPGKDYILVPGLSSESRRYVPMDFLTSKTIVTNLVQIIPDATVFHFGVLTSNVHMAWMRAVCGRLKSDYRYSKDIVYNNFPWPDATDEQKTRIEQTAQGILDARAKYPDSALKDLYNELTMPPDLRKAHQENDRAVMAAYGFPVKMSESECVAELFKRYQALASKGGEK